MNHFVERFFYPLLALAVVLLGLRVGRAFRRARAGLCPGPRTPVWRVVDPCFWLWTRACWYELSGCVPDAEGTVVCPECGTRQRVPTRSTRAFRWRFGRMALACAVLAMACRHVRWIRHGDWAPWAPTPVLLAMERASPARTPTACRDELYDRISAGSMWGATRRYAQLLAVRALRDDDVTGNAEWGQSVLSCTMDESVPILEGALDSRDYQTRQLAAMLLRQRWRRGAEPGPDGVLASAYSFPDRLLEVSVEGLGNDASKAPRSVRWIGVWSWWNAQDGFAFLCRNATRGSAQLAAGIRSDDVQERTLAAAIAAGCRVPGLLEHAAPVLCEACMSNSYWEDAQLACAALFRAGPDALPWVEQLMRCDDRQGASTGEYLVRRLRGEPMSEREILRLNEITTIAIDPLDARSDYPWPAERPGSREE